MYETSEIANLIRKKLEGTITTQELLLLKNWADGNPSYTEMLSSMDNEEMILEDD